jgi:DNA-binding Lrp family transcriptional regulator
MHELNKKTAELTGQEKLVINSLQGGFPVCARPFAKVASQIGMDEQSLIGIITSLKERNIISRFGPLFDIQKIGGNFCLCAISTPPDAWEETAEQLNEMPEVAHNYLRSHEYNLWFVLAIETAEQLADTVAKIEQETGYPVLALPKEKEYFVGLTFDVQ